jgi:hypothetical protein
MKLIPSAKPLLALQQSFSEPTTKLRDIDLGWGGVGVGWGWVGVGMGWGGVGMGWSGVGWGGVGMG